MKRALGNMSLKGKLLASYMIVFLTAAMTMIWYTITSSNQMQYDSNLGAVSGMAEKARDNFDRKIEQYDQAIAMCVYNEGLQQIYKNKYSTIYQLYRKLNDTFLPFYQSMYGLYVGEVKALCVYSTTGLYKWTSYLNSASAVEDAEWFKRAMGRKGIHWSVEDGDIYVTCRIDRMDSVRKDAPIGVLYMSLVSDNLLDQYLYLSWPAYLLTLRDSSGEALLMRQVGEVKEGEEMALLSLRSQAVDWTLEFSVPKRTLSVGSNALPFNFGVMISGLMALIAIITLFNRTLLSGLGRLKDTMAQVDAGNLDVVVSSASHDEIGALTDTFNHMLATIRRLLDQTRESERRLASMEAQMLRVQMDPHFLYNTLSFINWKCIRAGQDELSDVIAQLSTFYRTCLNKGGELMKVRTEVANMTAYVNIQLRLHDDSFSVSYDMPEELMDYQMIGFVLQPLVENAILHGVDKRREGGGALCVRLALEGRALVFTVRDNGPGLNLEDMEKLNGAGSDSAKGYGIRNVHDRITLRYGPRYGISVQNHPQGGCVATLSVAALEDANGAET